MVDLASFPVSVEIRCFLLWYSDFYLPFSELSVSFPPAFLSEFPLDRIMVNQFTAMVNRFINIV